MQDDSGIRAPKGDASKVPPNISKPWGAIEPNKDYGAVNVNAQSGEAKETNPFVTSNRVMPRRRSRAVQQLQPHPVTPARAELPGPDATLADLIPPEMDPLELIRMLMGAGR